MYEILERGEFKAGTTPNGITREEVLRIVHNGGSISVIDRDGNAFNIVRFDKYTIKIYPLVVSRELPTRTRAKNYIGVVEYPIFYDHRWIHKYTMDIESLPTILL